VTDVTPEEPNSTGHAEVDAALLTLEDLSGRPVEEHVAVFVAVHDQLRDVLSDPAALG